jgi:cell division protein FtsL
VSGERIKVVLHPGKLILKIMVLIMLVLCIAALLVMTLAIMEAKAEVDALRQQAALLQQENTQLQKDIANLGSVQSIIKIAMEKLGLVLPDTVIIEPNH